MIEGVDHIGVAVADLEKAKRTYSAVLNLECLWTETIDEQKVEVAAFQIGDTKIELLHPTTPDSPVGKFIAKKGEGVHHIALKVKDIDAVLSELREKGVNVIDEKARPGAGGSRIAFIHPKESNGVLIELVERED